MLIEKMTPADLEAVTALSAQLGYPEPLETFKARFAVVGHDPNHALWVAKEGGKIIGWAHVHRTAPVLITPEKAEISALVVDEAARSAGIGKALLKKAEEWAKENGLQTVKLTSNVRREKAHKFYLREGYQMPKLSGVFYKKIG